jgi:methylated-DNA-[protein]-cysteine S-methyltransferase
MQETRHAVVETALGELTLVATGPALAGVYFPGHWTMPDRSGFGVEVDGAADAVLAEAARELREYLAGGRTSFDLAAATSGGPFEERVWRLLREIPFGQTVTYGELAAELGEATIARGVGRAVGRNPLSIVIPCHRVVGKNGDLRGYAGGLERKRFLLDLEGAGQLSLRV